MSVPDDLEVYAWLSVQAYLREQMPTVHFIGPGMRPDTDGKEQWVTFNPMGDARMRTRRGVWGGLLLFEIVCDARLQESRNDKDTMAPFRLAALVRKTLEKVDVPLSMVGIPPETVLGAVQIKEARQSYLPRRNITFQGQGNFAVEQGNIHSVVVTFQAVLIASA
jgi:hypothetical protein